MKRESPRREPSGASKSLAGDSTKRNPQRRHSPATNALDWAITEARVNPISADRRKRIGVASTRLVLIGFTRYVNADDEAFPSAATLAEDLGLDRVHVTYALTELEYQGLLIRVSGKAGGKITRRLNREPVGEITTGRHREPVGEITTGEGSDLSGDLWSDLSGKSRQEVEVENLDTDPFPPHVAQRAREPEEWGRSDSNGWGSQPDPVETLLAEYGLSADRHEVLAISGQIETHGAPTRSPLGRLKEPAHAAQVAAELRRRRPSNDLCECGMTKRSGNHAEDCSFAEAPF